jgi:hypothetical protein
MPVSTVNPLPEPPNTTTDTKPVFLAKANTFNGELKKTIDGFNANVPELNAVGTAVNTVIPHLTQIDRVAQSAADVDVVAPKITDVETVSANITGVVSTANNMSAVLAAPSYAQRAETAAGQAEAIAGAGIATTSKAGLVKPRNGLAVDALGNLDVERAVFALGYPVVTMTPKVATGRPTNVSLSAPAVLLPGATVTAYHVSVDGGPVQDVTAVNNAATFTFTPAGAAGTTATLKVTATDSVGNVSLETTATAEVVNGYVVAPTLLSPVAGAKIGTTNCTFITSAFSSFGLDDTHVSTDYRIRDMSGNVVYLQNSTTDLITHITDMSEIPRGNNYQLDARHVGQQVGPSEYGPAVTVEFPTVMHGMRVAGGIAIGDASGDLFTFADGKKGYLVVTPASQRKASIKWGLYGTDTTLPNYTSGGFTDTKTGAQNTDVLTSSTYSSVNDGQGSVGAPAAAYCQNLEFEGCTDFFLPNYNETILIRTHKSLIDSLDETGTANPTFKLSNWGFGSVHGASLWCSSECSSDHAWAASASSEGGYNKGHQYGVGAARRIIVQ